MKLANITAKVRGMKFNAVKVLAAATLAGGFLVAAAPAAQAQRFAVEYRGGHRAFYGRERVIVAPPVVEYGDPYYAAPVYGPEYSVGFYGHGWDRDRGWDRRRDFDRDRRFDRDHDRGGWGRDRR
jgi:hypothetical protein